jgi:hypothetical protein
MKFLKRIKFVLKFWKFLPFLKDYFLSPERAGGPVRGDRCARYGRTSGSPRPRPPEHRAGVGPACEAGKRRPDRETVEKVVPIAEETPSVRDRFLAWRGPVAHLDT